MQSKKNVSKLPIGNQLDELAMALSEQIANEGRTTKNAVLQEILEAAQAPGKSHRRKSTASSTKRSGLSLSKGAQTLATSEA